MNSVETCLEYVMQDNQVPKAEVQESFMFAMWMYMDYIQTNNG